MWEASHLETGAETLSDCDAEDVCGNLRIVLITLIEITAAGEGDSISMDLNLLKKGDF